MVVILTADQFLHRGLRLVGFDDGQLARARRETKLEDFRSFFGPNPVVLAQIFEDLQTTAVDDARVEGRDLDVTRYLMAFFFLKVYPTENCKKPVYKVCVKTARKWCWYYCSKIQALKSVKVSASTRPSLASPASCGANALLPF